jgi:hypothetical protein
MREEALIEGWVDAVPRAVVEAGAALAAAEQLTGRRATLKQCRQVADAYGAEQRLVLLLMGYTWSSNYQGVIIDLLLPHQFMFFRDHCHLPKDLPGLAALALFQTARERACRELATRNT